MNKESLKKAKEFIIKGLYDLDINPVDKGELAINLFHLLDEDTYDKNIQTLRQREQNEKQISIEEYIKSLKPKGNKNDK